MSWALFEAINGNEIFNSFASFVAEDLGSEVRRELKKSENLDQFFQFIGGKDVFLRKLEAFDQINQKKIDLYQHHVNTLERKVGADLARQMRPLTNILYWRKAP